MLYIGVVSGQSGVHTIANFFSRGAGWGSPSHKNPIFKTLLRILQSVVVSDGLESMFSEFVAVEVVGI